MNVCVFIYLIITRHKHTFLMQTQTCIFYVINRVYSFDSSIWG